MSLDISSKIIAMSKPNCEPNIHIAQEQLKLLTQDRLGKMSAL